MREGRPVDWIHALPVAAAVLVDGAVEAVNGAAERLVRPRAGELTLQGWIEQVASEQGRPPDGRPVLARLDGDRWVAVHIGAPAADRQQIVLLVDASDHQLTRHALDAVAASTFLLDGKGRPRWRSEQLRQRSGLDDRAAADQNPSERIHPEDLPLVLNTFVDATPEKPSHVVVRSRAVDDDHRWETIEVVVHHRLDHDVLQGYLVQVHNLDDGVHLAGGLDTDDGAFLSLTEAAPVGIVVTDTIGEIVYRNRLARALLGADIQWLGRDSRWLELADADHRPALRDAFDAALHRQESSTTTAPFDDGAGGERWLRIAATPQRSSTGRPRGLIATIEDVTDQIRARTELDAAQAQLRHLADHDHLTGLPNRAALSVRLLAALDRHAAGGQGLAVLFCDLDGFKPINDRHGHVAGDVVLADVARRLREAVEDEAVVARMGGDEFVVLREGESTDDDLLALARRLHDHVCVPFDVGGHETTLAMSIGIAALTPGAASTAEQLLRAADQAMYEAKTSGLSRTVLRALT